MKSHLLFIICLFFSTQSALAQAPTNGLVAYYPFTGNANDAVGTLHGTVISATLTTDRFGNANQAYSFNGTDATIDFINPPTTATDNWTVSIWTKLAVLNQLGIMVNVGFDDGNTGNGFGLSVGSNNIAAGSSLLGNFGYVAFIPTGYTFPATDTWYHVTMIRQNGTTRFYVNATQTSQTTTTAPLPPANDFRIGSGSLGGGNPRYFNGSLDEVRIYNRALSEAEVGQLYNATCNASLTLSVSNPINCTATNATLTANGWTSGLTYVYTGPTGTQVEH